MADGEVQENGAHFVVGVHAGGVEHVSCSLDMLVVHALVPLVPLRPMSIFPPGTVCPFRTTVVSCGPEG